MNNTPHPLDALIWDDAKWLAAFYALLDSIEAEYREDEQAVAEQYDEDRFDFSRL